MKRELSKCEIVERSLFKTYRKRIWNPFIEAVKTYDLIEENDRIAVCISGGKDSMLLAKLMQLLQRHSDFPFEVKFISMNPGYNPKNQQQIEKNAEILEIPIEYFSTNIFDVAYKTEKNPCYLCAKMRRGHLYKQAKALNCNKIALGHHFNDVIETTLMAMLHSGQIQGMLPKLKSQNYPNMQLIRPLYCVKEDSIIAWKNYNNFEFLQCACKLTESLKTNDGFMNSKRAETKELIKQLKKDNKNIEKNIFNSIHNVNVDTMIEYKINEERHNFLEKFR